MTGVIKTDANGVIQTDANGVIQTVVSATPQFDVTITSTTSPVSPGDELGVTADVTNTGGAQGTQTITLNINNSVGQVDSTSVTLSAGGSTTQPLSWAVPSGQTEQDYTATVASADDTASQTVTVSSVPSSVVSRPQDDSVLTRSLTLGVRIEPDDDWPDIQGKISANVANATRAYIYRVSDGQLMDDTDISSLSAGGVFTLQPNLSANTQYNFVIDAQGADYDDGFLSNASFPYTSSDGRLEIVNGAQDKQSTANTPHNVVEVGNINL